MEHNTSGVTERKDTRHISKPQELAKHGVHTAPKTQNNSIKRYHTLRDRNAIQMALFISLNYSFLCSILSCHEVDFLAPLSLPVTTVMCCTQIDPTVVCFCVSFDKSYTVHYPAGISIQRAILLR